MNDIVIFKAADHVDDSVHLPDVGKKLIAQALALGGALYQTGDIHKFNHSRGHLHRMVKLRQLVQPRIRHRHDAYIGFNGAKGIVGRLGAGVGNRVKKGGFAHVRQTDNT